MFVKESKQGVTGQHGKGERSYEVLFTRGDQGFQLSVLSAGKHANSEFSHAALQVMQQYMQCMQLLLFDKDPIDPHTESQAVRHVHLHYQKPPSFTDTS